MEKKHGPFRILSVGRMTAPSSGAASGAPAPTPKIMVVQDEFLLRMATAADLRARGHHVVEAFSGAEAERALGADDRIALVLLDVTVGGEMAGLELARSIRRHHPAVKVLLTAAV